MSTASMRVRPKGLVGPTGETGPTGPTGWPARPVDSGWTQTPLWHPRYWFGHSMRRWEWEGVFGQEGHWEYATYKKCARQILEERYNATIK